MLDFRKGIHQLQWENHPTNENYYTNNENYYTNSIFVVIFIGWVAFDFKPLLRSRSFKKCSTSGKGSTNFNGRTTLFLLKALYSFLQVSVLQEMLDFRKGIHQLQWENHQTFFY